MQDKKLKLSVFVWKWISWNLIKFQLIQLIQTIVILILFQTDTESFSFLSWKTKKFYF